MQPLRCLGALTAFTVLSHGPLSPLPAARAQIVRSVLFFSPACAHCHTVIGQYLPGLFRSYGGEPAVWIDDTVSDEHRVLFVLYNRELEMLVVDVTKPTGAALYEASLASHPVRPAREGIPRLVIGDSVLVGSTEIPTHLPDLVRGALAGGGGDWPSITGLPEAIAAIPTPRRPPSRRPSMLDKLRGDPVGNTIAVLIMVGMTASVVAVFTIGRLRAVRHLGVAVPVVAFFGLAVTTYLTYAKATGAAAVCGPIGDCNAVQQSPYAVMFGVLPVTLLGALVYLAILIASGTARVATGAVAAWATVCVLGMSLGGTLFAIYLTFLEPFVIGATCVWCLTSAAGMTVLLWLAAGPCVGALIRLRHHAPLVATPITGTNGST